MTVDPVIHPSSTHPPTPPSITSEDHSTQQRHIPRLAKKNNEEESNSLTTPHPTKAKQLIELLDWTRLESINQSIKTKIENNVTSIITTPTHYLTMHGFGVTTFTAFAAFTDAKYHFVE